MKTLFKSLMLIAVAAMTFTSCSKDNGIDNGGSEGPMVQLTLRAGNPEIVAAVSDSRTELIAGTPYWSVGDKIGVSTNGTSTNYMFTNTAEDAAKTTTFTGSTTVSSTIYTYYPYTSNGVGNGADGATGAKIDIPVNQNPSATSFDGKADLLVGKPLTLAAEGTTVADLQFARVGGIVKVILKDNSTDKKLSDQHVSTLSVTTDGTNYLAGRVLLDVVNSKLYEPYYNQSNSVTANYTAETQYEINGTNAAFLSVYPRTLENGSKLTIEASTEGYSIKKEISLTSMLEILAGKVTTLNITLTDENITASASGLALPFKDDFAWVNELSGTAALTIDQYPSNADQVALYTATDYTYPEAPALKLGSSKQRGFFTTTDLDLSRAFTVIVRAKTFSSDESALQVTAGEAIKTSDNLTADYKYYAFEFDAQSAKSKVKVEVTGKRGYIIDFQVVEGHGVALPTVLTITSPTTVTALGTGETLTMTYLLENPVAGIATPTASTTNSWIHDFNYGTAGEISFVVDKNEGEKRTGTINISYNDLPAQQITINQAASGGAPKEYTVTLDVNNFKALTSGSGYAVFNGDHTFMATASDGSEYEVVFNTNQFMIQSGKVQGQKNNGVIYNQTNLGKITSVVITTLSGPVTMYEGPAKQPKDTTIEGANGTYTFSGNNGFMQLTAGSKTVTFDSMTITFTL